MYFNVRGGDAQCHTIQTRKDRVCDLLREAILTDKEIYYEAINYLVSVPDSLRVFAREVQCERNRINHADYLNFRRNCASLKSGNPIFIRNWYGDRYRTSVPTR